MRVSIIVFTLNEIDGMRTVMPRLKREWYDELVIVDGGSTDGTVEYANEAGYCIFRQKGKGAGAAFREAMKKRTEEIVVMFSRDGNSITEKIREVAAKIR